ncbi:unnamed protein product [Schistosoma mattheei]|uniref:Uncharacterized protein n=1 Tax=Schistosoma mattheei TaxID=31246 RepID=A0A183PD89_9TREM|nr:unnamed protein product [Schistosoma mattheei]
MLIRDSQQEILHLDFMLLGGHHQGIPVILRELILPDGFGLVSPSFTVKGVTTERSGSLLTSCRTEIYLKLIDRWVVINSMYFGSNPSGSISSLKITGTRH